MKTDVLNRGLNDNLFNDLCSFYDELPFTETLGLNLVYLGNGIAGVRMIVKHGFTAVNGRLQGGFTAILADHVMGWAIKCLALKKTTTVDIHVDYLSPVFEGTDLIGEGIVIKAGESIVVAEARVFDSKDKLVAKASGTFI